MKVSKAIESDLTVIAVDLDWGSSGLWIQCSGNHWKNLSYDGLSVPVWLVARFQFWTNWYNRKRPDGFSMTKDERELFAAYQLTLALDLRLFLDETQPGEFEVRSGRKRIVEVPANAKEPPLED